MWLEAGTWGRSRGVVNAVWWWWHGWHCPQGYLAELRLPPPSWLIWILQGELCLRSGKPHVSIPFGRDGEVVELVILGQCAHIRYCRSMGTRPPLPPSSPPAPMLRFWDST